MIPQTKERTAQLVTTGGTGALVLGSSVSGSLAFQAADDNKSFDILIVNSSGGAWEVCRDAVYTHSTTTITRGTRLSSSSGSAITVDVGATVYVVPTGFAGQSWEHAAIAVVPGGRLTLTSNTPIPVSDVVGGSTLYYTPYKSGFISLYDGVRWSCITFAQTPLTLSGLTNGSIYDVFAYQNSGALTLELSAAWSNSTTRTDTLSYQDGILVKTSNPSRRYIGTIRATDSTTTEDSAVKRFVYNHDNRILETLNYYAGESSHTYASSTFQQYNASSASRIEFVVGEPSQVAVSVAATGNASTTTVTSIGAGLDSTNNANIGDGTYSGATIAGKATYSGCEIVSAGYHYVALLEKSIVNGQTITVNYGRIRAGVSM